MKPSVVSLVRCYALVLLLTCGTSLAGPTIQWAASEGGTYRTGDIGTGNDPSELLVNVGAYYGMEDRGYLVFDFASLADEVLSASLEFDVASVWPDGSVTISLYDVLTPIEYLTSRHEPIGSEPGPSVFEIWTDLNEGTTYGSALVTDADEGSHVSFTFNQDGIDAINAAQGGSWALALSAEFSGSTVRSGALDLAGDNYLNMQTVPEPSTMALFALGGITAALAAARSRSTS